MSYGVVSVVAASVRSCATSDFAVCASAKPQTKDLSLGFANLPGNFMVTDPIADLLVRLQNASMARKTEVLVPFSKMKSAVVNVLAREGYIGDIDTKKKEGALMITLTYRNSTPAIRGVKRLSKPGRRLYAGVRDLRPVKRGHGLLVLSTPAGILTGKEARDKRMGGEMLFEIW